MIKNDSYCDNWSYKTYTQLKTFDTIRNVFFSWTFSHELNMFNSTANPAWTKKPNDVAGEHQEKLIEHQINCDPIYPVLNRNTARAVNFLS